MTISLVQAPVSNSGTAGTTLTLTLGSATTAGNCLVVVITTHNASTVNPAVSGVTIGGSADNFASLFATGGATDESISAFWTDPNCAGGQTSVVITFSSVTSPRYMASVYEFSGLAATNAALLDKSAASATGANGTSFSSTSTATTANAVELWVGLVSTDTTTVTGPASPWTNIAQVTPAGTASDFMSGYQIRSATGAAAYAGTFSPSAFYNAAVVTLNPAGGTTASGALSVTGTAGAAAAAPSASGALAITGTVTVPVPPPPPTPIVLVLPQIIVEAGLATTTPVQVSTVLILDDPVLGLLDTATLGGGITWSAVSPKVISFSVTRPSTRLAGPLWNYQAGTASILLDNSDGSFDPDNLAGPYVTGGATELLPMVPVRIRAVFAGVTYALYSGYADGWMPAQVTYAGGYAELTLPATDAFKVLAGITLPALGSPEGVGATSGARIRDILTRAGWWTSAEYTAVGPGSSTLQGTSLGDTALNLMQIATDSEIGQLYVNGAGAVTFRGRQQILSEARSNTVQAVFGDLPGTVHAAGTELACAAIGRASDDTTIANDIQATHVGGNLQEAQDAASIAKYLFPRSYARSDLILQGDPDALAWAQWVLYVSKGGEDRFESLQVDPAADPANLWPQVLGREIGDRIEVWVRPAGVASPVSKDCFIAGITHTWDSVTSAWLTTFSLQDCVKYGSFLTLDNPTTGQLDANALTF
ncbi:MAG TPA: hypothetical protein VK817_00740 [Trebonia sp.]|nr:hypothetical protein [Trebonia sp.]